MQDDYSIDNAPGAAVRQDINNHLETIATNNSGQAAPTPTFPYMLWVDTANGLIKRRNGANTAWVTIGAFSGSTWTPYREGSPSGTAMNRDVGTGAGTNLLDRDQLDGRFLNESSNLSDVPNKATARSNLDVYSVSQAQSYVQSHVDSHFPTSNLASNSVGTNELVSSQHMTNANVRSMISSSSLGQVGTYAWLETDAANSINAGGTISGSNLHYPGGGLSDPAGTWRNMSGDRSGSETSLFLRVS